MREEQLELLITIDDPVGLPEEDIFNHLHANNLEYWLSQFPGWRVLDQRTEAVNDNDASRLTFGQGDWTCTLSTLNGTTNGSMKGSNLDVCTVTQWKDGEMSSRSCFVIWPECRSECAPSCASWTIVLLFVCKRSEVEAS